MGLRMPSTLQEFLVRSSPLMPVLLIGLSVMCGVWAGLRLARWSVARRVRGHRAMGTRGAEDGLRILARYGCEVVELEVTGAGRMSVDGEVHRCPVRVDARVRHEGREYLAEFKGGPRSALPTNRATRRQLLEYAWAFGVDGLLLVDADAGTLRTVRFLPAQKPAAFPSLRDSEAPM